jgi:hypothetical protein
LCGGMEEKREGFEAGPKIILRAALLTRLFTTLVGLSVVGEDVSLEMSAGLCGPSNPLTQKRFRIYYWMIISQLWS